MSFKVRVVHVLPAKVSVRVVPVVGEHLGRIPQADELRRRGFEGGWGVAEFIVNPLNGESSFLAVIGLGEKTKVTLTHFMSGREESWRAEGMRRGIARVIQDARRHALHQVVIDLRELPEPAVLARAAIEGADLANYRFTEYLPRVAKDQQAKAVREIILVVPQEALRIVQREVVRIQAVLAGVKLARDLVNQPASAVSPAFLVKTARAIAQKTPEISLKILNRAQAARAGMHAFLAVARGSQEEPYVIDLRYRPKHKAAKKIALIGKGVTFDSGGLSLKPAEMMEAMKCDMAGAASVLGLFSALHDLQPEVEVHGIIPACENMPSGNAYRPGDVLTAKNGKTIEVLNTDAEGRITLADALGYALEQKPDAVIDLATLTGACMVGLGETVAGLWATDRALATELLSASDVSGEQIALMPLPEELRVGLLSKVADIRNIAMTRFGGAVTAALFLREFVGTTPWAHLDIAGPSWAERSYLSYYEHGGTGFGVRLLAEYLKNV